MISIQFPAPDFRIRLQDGYDEIFDIIRKLWVKLTPEEWVRQNFIAYLVKNCYVPSSLISIEKEILVGELKRRFDVVVYDRNGFPWMLVECKAIDVMLTEKTIAQMLGYLSNLSCPFVFITNGTYTYGWEITNRGFLALEAVPDFL
ncbi:type I restriction enzyme HsdR N-terminal domain-containing protein [soil metagenome]